MKEVFLNLIKDKKIQFVLALVFLVIIFLVIILVNFSQESKELIYKDYEIKQVDADKKDEETVESKAKEKLTVVLIISFSFSSLFSSSS